MHSGFRYPKKRNACRDYEKIPFNLDKRGDISLMTATSNAKKSENKIVQKNLPEPTPGLLMPSENPFATQPD
jgi:hypothetical protein